MKNRVFGYSILVVFALIAIIMVHLEEQHQQTLIGVSAVIVFIIWLYPPFAGRFLRTPKKDREIEVIDFMPEILMGTLILTVFGFSFVYPQLDKFGFFGASYSAILYLPKSLSLHKKAVERISKDEREQFLLYKADSYTLRIFYALAAVIILIPEIKLGVTLTPWQGILCLTGAYAITTGLMNMVFFEQPAQNETLMENEQ